MLFILMLFFFYRLRCITDVYSQTGIVTDQPSLEQVTVITYYCRMFKAWPLLEAALILWYFIVIVRTGQQVLVSSFLRLNTKSDACSFSSYHVKRYFRQLLVFKFASCLENASRCYSVSVWRLSYLPGQSDWCSLWCEHMRRLQGRIKLASFIKFTCLE